MAGALSTYSFLNAKLKARVSRVLTPDHIDRLVRSASLSEAMVLLRGTSYEALDSAYSATGDLRAGEALLFAAEVQLYTGLYRFLKEPVYGFVRAMAGLLEVENLKAAVRIWFDAVVRGRPDSGLTAYLYRADIAHHLDLDRVVAAPDVGVLADALEGTPYAAVVAERGAESMARKSLFPLETALDRLGYATLFAAAARLSRRDRGVAERIIGIDADIQNVGWLVRLRSFYGMGAREAFGYLIPTASAVPSAAEGKRAVEAYESGDAGGLLSGIMGGKYGGVGALLGSAGDGSARLAALEKALRDIAEAETARLLVGDPFSIGVPLAYFALKRAEMRAVMAILNAKYYALPEERIRAAL